ncbi:hypothetical protein ACWKX9_26810, partial [Enterobacter asburiae]
GAGGLNPYAYCGGDPVNHTDPSGHLSMASWINLGASVIGIALAIFSAGSSIAAAAGVIGGLETAEFSVTEGVLTTLSVLSDSTNIASNALSDAAPKASTILGMISIVSAIPGALYDAPDSYNSISHMFKPSWQGLRRMQASRAIGAVSPVLGGGALIATTVSLAKQDDEQASTIASYTASALSLLRVMHVVSDIGIKNWKGKALEGAIIINKKHVVLYGNENPVSRNKSGIQRGRFGMTHASVHKVVAGIDDNNNQVIPVIKGELDTQLSHQSGDETKQPPAKADGFV